MRNVDNSYSEAMRLTGVRIEHIFTSKDHFSKVRLIMRDIYYPENEAEDFKRISVELDKELNSLTTELTGLHEVAGPAVRDKVEIILPMVETYRADAKKLLLFFWKLMIFHMIIRSIMTL